MRTQKIMKLVKDLLLAAVFFGIGMAVTLEKAELTTGIQVFLGICVAGIPFGWRWASKVFTAFTVHGVLLKALISLFLGWLALPIALVGDIIGCFTAPSAKAAA